MDMVFGSLASLLAAWLTWLLRKNDWLAALPPVVVNGVAAVGPVINTVTDSTSKAINGQLSSGGALVLGGVNLKIQGDDPSIGVYLTPTTEGAAPMKALPSTTGWPFL